MTIKEIAKLAGVSISTVSKIVNNKDENINIETRNKVLQIVKEYNYTPYSTVRAVSTAKTFLIGVLLRSAPKSNLLINGMMEAARESGYSLLLYYSGKDPALELKNISSLCRHKVDGVIWEPVDGQSLLHRRYFDEQDIQVCLIGALKEADVFAIDYAQIASRATETLIHYGHSKLGCLTEGTDFRSCMVLEGFKKCLFSHGIPYADSMNLSAKEGGLYEQILTRNLTGVVCSDYRLSLQLVEQLSKIHFHIPYDLSLLSLQEDMWSDLSLPGISCIQIPYHEFGVFVCRRLIEKCEKIDPALDAFRPEYKICDTRSLDIPFSSHVKKIVVVGSLHIDVTLNVDELPQPGKAISTQRHSTIPGGKGANQAVGVAKLGSEVSLIGRVGNDFDASVIYACMEENNVNVRAVMRDPYSETGKAFIHVQDDGESMITILTGANQNLSPKDILSNEKLFENAGYCLLPTEIPDDVIETAAKTAHRYGAKNILKPAAIHRIKNSLMELADLFIPNEKEAEILCPEIPDTPGKADAFLARGAKAVIITLGGAGCYIKSPAFTGYLPAADFMSVDTTGAADAFISALAVYLSCGYPMEKAARIASYAAGFCVSRQGVIPSLVDRNSLESHIRQIEPELLQIIGRDRL
ncbi:MAG: LacI family DNA-binding transcriptional regulator [Lachnospiraceae bacterium]|nr:LacI family DNA-binding transcriptional regulator [Lachnospiraceae bacterium]